MHNISRRNFVSFVAAVAGAASLKQLDPLGFIRRTNESLEHFYIRWNLSGVQGNEVEDFNTYYRENLSAENKMRYRKLLREFHQDGRLLNRWFGKNSRNEWTSVYVFRTRFDGLEMIERTREILSEVNGMGQKITMNFGRIDAASCAKLEDSRKFQLS